jgi:hypothetical protein
MLSWLKNLHLSSDGYFHALSSRPTWCKDSGENQDFKHDVFNKGASAVLYVVLQADKHLTLCHALIQVLMSMDADVDGHVEQNSCDQRRYLDSLTALAILLIIGFCV